MEKGTMAGPQRYRDTFRPPLQKPLRGPPVGPEAPLFAMNLTRVKTVKCREPRHYWPRDFLLTNNSRAQYNS
jgi:hypothetical protein